MRFVVVVFGLKKKKNIILKALSVVRVILGGNINMAIPLASLLSHLIRGLIQEDCIEGLMVKVTARHWLFTVN